MTLRGLSRSVFLLCILASACAADEQTSATSEQAPVDAGRQISTVGAARPLELTDVATTPNLDRSIAIVDLGRIIFDTFDGGGIPLSEADDATILRLRDAIAPLDAPLYQDHAAAGNWLNGDDLVVGYVDPQGGAWAYAVRILNSREIVNDELGGLPVVVTYCPLCGSGVVYARGLGDLALSFSNTSALFENDMVMVDRETGTYWWQVAGTGLVGERAGASLQLLPSQTTTWASWREQHPSTQVMARPDGRDYSRDAFENYGASLDAGRTPFPVRPDSLTDDRLAPSDRVVVISIDGESRAWATAPVRTVDAVVGGVEVTVRTDGVGAVVTTTSGELVPNRTAFWFSVLTTDPNIALGE